MVIIMWVVVIIILSIGGFYTFLVATGTDNLKGINLQLNQVFKDNEEMTLAVVKELEKQGKKCEILKLKKSFSVVNVEGEEYFVSGRFIAMAGIPVQTIQLKPLKK